MNIKYKNIEEFTLLEHFVAWVGVILWVFFILYFVCFVICFIMGLDGHKYYMGGDLDYGDCARPANTRIEVIRNYTTPFKFGCWLSERLVPVGYKL